MCVCFFFKSRAEILPGSAAPGADTTTGADWCTLAAAGSAMCGASPLLAPHRGHWLPGDCHVGWMWCDARNGCSYAVLGLGYPRTVFPALSHGRFPPFLPSEDLLSCSSEYQCYMYHRGASQGSIFLTGVSWLLETPELLSWPCNIAWT